ncbi:type-2 ice-structuring protein-like [Xyrichtys novacula]|uniref:Type-2 ice-structuring protein-like n=1 Tax=Xyrichtys novacula TaxID=13765 RepID=A0AAV1HIS9_XYRNO|nr:type-2 ice-structuring protein-like [Xyrichtys novacula]
MKLLAVSALLCAAVALTGAFVLPEDDQQELVDFLEQRGTCTGTWSEFNGRCFRYFPKAMPWADAELNCQSFGANLASIHNIEEYHEIQRLVLTNSYQTQLSWIGGFLAHDTETWLWSDGSRFVYQNWCEHEAEEAHEGPCVDINQGYGKCWGSATCTESLPFLCSKKM